MYLRGRTIALSQTLSIWSEVMSDPLAFFRIDTTNKGEYFIQLYWNFLDSFMCDIVEKRQDTAILDQFALVAEEVIEEFGFLLETIYKVIVNIERRNTDDLHLFIT